MGVADITDLGVQWITELVSPIYSDAADVGIAVKSERTGEYRKFVFVQPLIDVRENEITGWELTSFDGLIKLHILND